MAASACQEGNCNLSYDFRTDVMDALPHELSARGHEVSVALPFYREIRENPAFKEEDTGVTVDIRVGDKT